MHTLPLPPGEDTAVASAMPHASCSPSLGTSRDIGCQIQPLYSAFSHRLGYLVQSSQAQKANAVVVYLHGNYPNISLRSTGDWGRSFPHVGGPQAILQSSYKGFRP